MSIPVARVLRNAEELSRCLDIIVAAFQHTALTNAFISEIDNKPPPFDKARRRKHFEPAYEAMIRDGAIIVESGDWSAVAVWEPPELTGNPLASTSSTGPLRAAWRRDVEQCKARHMSGPSWHLDFLARNPDKPPIPGSITAVLKPYLDQAAAAGIPAWLEATNLQAVRVYKHFGFELVEKIMIGAGKIDPNGWPEEGGEGVSAYCMMFKPESTLETQDPVS